MSRIMTVRAELAARPAKWLVTGAAGFIGSHLVEELLRLGQRVRGLDNFSTGHPATLEQVRAAVGDSAWGRFEFVEADVTDEAACRRAVHAVDYVLHQAALGSVPRSIENPLATFRANVDGFVTMLAAAQKAGVKRFVYASSSSVYGDHPAQPKVEEQTGALLSPYALSKSINEQTAALFGRVYGAQSIGLRYFNVFGPRQDPAGPYAAVLPRWVKSLLRGERCTIHGDGATSRDFCYISNVVQANLLAAAATDEAALNQVYNIAVGQQTSLTGLYGLLRDGLAALLPDGDALRGPEPLFGPFRAGDIRHSLADISKAQRLLGYAPTHTTAQGINETLPWYVAQGAAPLHAHPAESAPQ